MTAFVTETVLKRDVFSETRKGHFAQTPDAPVVRRLVSAAPWWSRPLARLLARREVRGLKAVGGIAGTPALIAVDRDGLFRHWSDGTPLHLARPADPFWYRDAARLLRDMRRAGITHNDLAKPQNWLVRPDGSAAVIDFQLASCHRRRGLWYRLLAYEDRRHLAKQKRAFAPQLLTAGERRILARRSLPSRLWRATGKRLYNALTRGVLRWSDGEGTGDRLEREAAAILAALKRHPAVADVALAVFPLPRRGTGIYAFVETREPLTGAALAALRRTPGMTADLVQPVARLPRGDDGRLREDVLCLIAMNRVAELDGLTAGDAALAAGARAIAAARLNLGDRRLAGAER